MRKNKVYIISATVLLSLCIVYASAMAEHSGKKMGWRGKNFCLKSLGLTDVEISDIKAIKLKYIEEGIRVRAQKDIAMLHLKTALVNEASEAKLKPLMLEVLKAKRGHLLNKVSCIRATSQVIKDDKTRKAYLEKAVEYCLSNKKRCDGKKGKHCDYKDAEKED